MPENSDLFRNLSELVQYLRDKSPSLQSLLQFVTLRTLAPLGATSLFVSQVNTDGEISLISQFGFPEEVVSSWQKSYIKDRTPVADALKTNSLLWLVDQENYDDEYPILHDFLLSAKAHCFVTAPMHIKGSYMAVAGISITHLLPPDAQLKSFVETVFNLIGMHASVLYGHDYATDTTEKLAKVLSRRQREILKLLADGMTNSQIGRDLGYSSSTIRQDTMKIYEALGVPGRKAARLKYREMM